MREPVPAAPAYSDVRPTHALAIVTPVFEDREASARLFRELAAITGRGAYVVAVDDGSVRLPLDAAAIDAAGLEGVVIRLKRNVGHQRAIAVGLSFVAAHAGAAQRVVVMDSDGEDLPASIPELLQLLEDENVDVVVARRRNRAEGLRFRAFYAIYKALFHLLTGRAIAFGNFIALKPAALARIAAMQELWIHFAACVLSSRLRIALCPQDRGPRYAGVSQMNFVSLALHGFRAFTVFTEDVFVRVGIACAAVAALSVAASVLAVVLKVLGYATPGWFSIALGILLLVFMQTGTLTLLTLMLAGTVRGRVVAAADWEDYVASVSPARVRAA
jgi:polyisoprenyl-phosphate glycosyltransferase